MTYKPNKMKDCTVLIVDGKKRMIDIEKEYEDRLYYHDIECQRIRESYVQKTSRVKKNKAGDIGEYTNWFHKLDDGRLMIFGKKEPDYKKLYPEKPPEPFRPGYEIQEDNILMLFGDFLEIQKRFKGCWIFDIEDKLMEQ